MHRNIQKTQRHIFLGGMAVSCFGLLLNLPLSGMAQPADSGGISGSSTIGPTATPPTPSVPTATPPIQPTPVPVAAPITAEAPSIPSVKLPPVPRTTRAVGTITGQGTSGNIAKFTGTNSIGNSALVENSGKVGLGTTSPAGLLGVVGNSSTVPSIYGSNAGAGTGVNGVSSGGSGVYGSHTSSSGDTAAILGETNSTSANGTGVRGVVKSTSPGTTSSGVRGINQSTNANGYGVYGSHAGKGTGVYGTSSGGNGVWGASSSGIGVRGSSTESSGANPGVLGETKSTSANAVGVQGVVSSTSPGDASVGVQGINKSTGGNGYGVYGTQAGSGIGVLGVTPNGNGVIGRSTTSTGVSGVSVNGFGAAGQSTSGYGLYGESSQSDGVYGISHGRGTGVHGHSDNLSGVLGDSGRGDGVTGVSTTGRGVSGTGYYGVVGTASGTSNDTPVGVTGYAISSNAGSIGIVGSDGSNGQGPATAGYFLGKVSIIGNLSVGGTLTKGAGSFKIDDPLHPATEYLSHSFVESPDMMNIYNGNTTTNAKGEAWVQLPAYFSALNTDFRYQLTPIGQFAQAIIGQKIKANRFLIRTDKPNVEVSWLVTGVRQDVYAREHRIKVEEPKTGDERGKYLYPAGFGAGADKQIGQPLSRLATAPIQH